MTARLRDTDWSADTVVTEGLRTQQLVIGLSVRCTSPVAALADASEGPEEPDEQDRG